LELKRLEIQNLLSLIFVIGACGSCLELFLLEHTENTWQWIPIVLIGGSLVVQGWHRIAKTPTSVRVLQAVMLLFVVSGFVGLSLHYKGNVEFEQEMYPSLKGLDLFVKAIKGATPALAPGTMIQLGLLGLAFTYRHPVLTNSNDHEPNQSGEME
jgi:hypothetical protein